MGEVPWPVSVVDSLAVCMERIFMEKLPAAAPLYNSSQRFASGCVCSAEHTEKLQRYTARMAPEHPRLRTVRAVLLAGPTLVLAACAMLPWHARQDAEGPATAVKPVADTPEARAKYCHDLKAEIAWYEKQRRSVPPLTSSPEIAAAAEGKNDNKIDILRQRYEAEGCEDGG
jgi:hypothetical protein